MQNPTWFDQSYYLSQKLAQMQATDPSYTMFKLEKAIADTGMTPYQHFANYGVAEGLSPSPFFNIGEYLEAKAAQLNADGGSGWTAASVLSAIEKIGMTPWEHYVKYGSQEGVNPSNNFDEATYLAAKLAQLQRDDAANWGTKTVEDVQKAFAATGINSLEHYLTYGRTENIVMDESQLVTRNPVPSTPVKLATQSLTTQRDNLVGSNGNDVFLGKADTWTSGDGIDGGAGHDTLRLDYVGNIAAGNQTVKNVERLEVIESASTAWTGDVSAFEGLQEVAVKGGDTVGLTLGKSVSDVSLDGNAGAATITGDGVTHLSVSNTKGNVTLNNAVDHNLTLVLDTVGDKTTQSTIADATAGAVNMVANGTSHVKLVANAAKNLNVAGVGNLTIANDLTGHVLENINAATMSGDLTISQTLGTGIGFTGGTGSDNVTVDATTKQILTGKGNDTVNLTGSTIGKNGLVDGGDGRDTLGMSFANAGAVLAGFTDQVKNFEVLHLGGAAATATVDMDMFSANNAIDTVVVDASAKAFTLDNLVNKSTVQLTGDMDEAATLLVKGATSLNSTSDMLNLLLGGESNVADMKAGLVLTGLEELNITSQGATTHKADATDDNQIASLTGLSNNATVNIKGGTDLSLVTGNMGIAATFDATSFTGNLTLNASANSKDVSITGGSGNDVITGGLGNDTIKGGLGNDTINSSAGHDTLTGGEGKDIFAYTSMAHSTLAGMDVITDFKHSEDKLDLSGTSAALVSASTLTAVQDAVKGLGTDATLTDALNAAAGASDTANGTMWFEFGGKTYVYQESATGQSSYKAGDMVIELTGTSLGLTTDDFTV